MLVSEKEKHLSNDTYGIKWLVASNSNKDISFAIKFRNLVLGVLIVPKRSVKTVNN